MSRFIGREPELTALRKEFAQKRPSLLIVYGRRRVGKSRLLQEAVSGRPFIYFQASRETSVLNIEALKRTIAAVLGPDPLLAGLSGWEGIFHYLAGAAKRQPGLAIILDEFSYLCDSDPALPSVLQKFWDSGQPNEGRLKLILCGSVISSMEALLAERNPLYGRQTGKFDIRPLILRDSAKFFPTYSAEDKILAYAIFGGIPYYLEACDPNRSLEINVNDLLLSRTGRLFEEPANILQSELREVKIYSSIVHAIASGAREHNEIKTKALGSDAKISLSPYLDQLTAMRLVRVVRSIDAAPKSRNNRYIISDRLMDFWHRFVGPNAESISLGFGSDVWKRQIAPRLSDYMGPVFEEICRDHARLHSQEILHAPAQTVGQLWAADYDIDVTGRLLDGAALYGECKWSTSLIGENILDLLLERAGKTDYGKEAKMSYHLIYSRTGFTDSLRARGGTTPSLRLLTLSDLLGAPDRKQRKPTPRATPRRPTRRKK